MTNTAALQGETPEWESHVLRIMQEVNDLSPWAHTYQERPDDLLEVRAAQLELILRAVLEPVPDNAMHYDSVQSVYTEGPATSPP